MDVLIIFACFYFAYSTVTSVLASEQPWAWGQYASLAISAVLVVLGIIRTINYLRTYKSRQQEREHKKSEQEQKIHEQRRRVYLYDTEGYVDEEPEAAPSKAEEDDIFIDSLLDRQALELASEDVKDVTDETDGDDIYDAETNAAAVDAAEQAELADADAHPREQADPAGDDAQTE